MNYAIYCSMNHAVKAQSPACKESVQVKQQKERKRGAPTSITENGTPLVQLSTVELQTITGKKALPEERNSKTWNEI
jgi:hypothetical protein